MASEKIMSMTLDEIINFKRKMYAGRNNISVKGRLNKKRPFQRQGQVRENRKAPLAGRLSKRADNKRLNISLQQRLGKPMKQSSLPINRRIGNFGQQRRLFTRENILQDQYSYEFRRKPSQNFEQTRNLKTKSNLDPFHVRISGAIVRGLRSDQLLLEKLRQQQLNSVKAKVGKFRILRSFNNNRHQAFVDEVRKPTQSRSLGGPSKVSLSVNRGLTVNIRNEAAHQYKRALPKRSVAPLAVRRRPPTPSESEEEDDEEMESNEEMEEAYPREPLRLPPRKRQPEAPLPKDDPQVLSLMRIAAERPPPPKPHRQVLDPQIQREIATLQGKQPHPGSQVGESGPGPGVKGFKMIPTKTKNSLNQRFTQEGKHQFV